MWLKAPEFWSAKACIWKRPHKAARNLLDCAGGPAQTKPVYYKEPEIYDRIEALSVPKLQRLLSWMSDKELVGLMNSVDQNLEDAVLDNVSKAGREVLLENLGFSEEDFQNRAVVRRKVNERYLLLLAELKEPPSRPERIKMIEKLVEELPPADRQMHQSRFKDRMDEMGEALRAKIRGYLDLLEKDASYKPQ